MTTTLYGIPNCDTVKKARKWLDANGIEYRFHDFRKDGINETMIREWMKTQPLELLLNKRGTTWRQLPDDVNRLHVEGRHGHVIVRRDLAPV